MQACLSSSGNVANRFNPMNEVLILYQFNLGTGLSLLFSNRRIARQSNDEELVPEALGVVREGYRLNEVVRIHATVTECFWASKTSHALIPILRTRWNTTIGPSALAV